MDEIREMICFLKKKQINYQVCGKIVLASDDREISLLDNLTDRGARNGLKGLKLLKPYELRQREPSVNSLSKSAFLAEFKKLVPDFEESMFVKGRITGVLAQAVSPKGN